ncbi:MAG: hypothetical protein Q8941_17575 [Bacteroidota bacterium]|nr:hypothetical protein [Bacteroidota bacterium]
MKTKTVTTMGALHPILFFAVMYVVVLFFSIFICSSLFYSCKSSPAKMAKKTTAPAPRQAEPAVSTAAVVLR